MEVLHEEMLEGGYRYSEVARAAHLADRYPSLRRTIASKDWPGRLCLLWAEGEREPVSSLVLYPIEQRWGSVSTPAEGVGWVLTVPGFRGRGCFSRLIRKSLARAAERVPAVFLFGVRELYPKFGFATCMVHSTIELAVHVGERTSRSNDRIRLRDWSDSDMDAARTLCNEAHATRPCSAVRPNDRPVRPRPADTWDAGQAGLVAERDGRLAGYMFHSVDSFGQRLPLSVGELVAADPEAARALVHHVLQIAIGRRFDRIIFNDVPDSLTGLVLRQLGAEVRLVYPADNEGQGLVLDRPRLIEWLTPELERRAGGKHDRALSLLSLGELVADNQLLMPLLTGFLSWDEAVRLERSAPTEFDDTLRRWFPGTGHSGLPLPYTLLNDRY